MTAPIPNSKLSAQVRQFDWVPGRGQSLLRALAEPSPSAVAGEAWSQNRVEDPIVQDDEGNRTRGYVEQRSPVADLPLHRDYYRDFLESAGIPDPDFPVRHPIEVHRDTYRDFYDSAGIYRPTPEPEEE